MTKSTRRTQDRNGWQGRYGILVAAGMLAGALSAQAAPVLPNFTALTQCSSGQQGITGGSAGCTQSGSDGSDSTSFTVSPFSSLTAQAAVVGGVPDGFAVLNYSFEVVGGNPGDQVPLLIATGLSAITSVGPAISDGYAFSEIVVSTGLAGANETICSVGCCAGTGETSFSGVLDATAASGTIDTVHLEVEASSQSLPGLGITSSASADPYIYVDPSFAGASNYSILVSPGVGNALPSSTATPEPGSLWLVPIAMGAILAERLRRRRANAAPRA